MLSDTDRDALEDLADNIARVTRFVGRSKLEDFLADDKTFYAATRCLEIVSEATRRLSPNLKARHPHIPWKAAAGSGSIYRQSYETVPEQRVWATIHDALPALRIVVDAELEA